MAKASPTLDGLRIEPLGPETWDAYAALIERHNGIFGGCWCKWFSAAISGCGPRSGEDNRAFKQRLVHEGKAHAAVVLDGDRAVAWCQYGKPEELPDIHHRKEYDETSTRQPEYRLTCIFVDRDHRRHGVAEFALRGALDLIALAGGGDRRRLPPRHARQKGLGVVPLQHHAHDVRTMRLRVRPASDSLQDDVNDQENPADVNAGDSPVPIT